jgi:type IV secretion system protein VirB11
MGVFAKARRASETLDEVEQQLLALAKSGRYEEFMRLAVRSRKNVVVSGATGSGKTTFTRALIRDIPRDERLVTIEDAPELVLDEHPNHVKLFYSKGDQGQAKVTPRQLLESCLRMRPDRILLAELRSDEAFDYLRNANSGHPGSITSVHASSAELAFEQLTLLVKQSKSGGDLPREDIKTLLYTLIDIVVQFAVIDHQRCISEIWYEPHRKRAMAAGT